MLFRSIEILTVVVLTFIAGQICVEFFYHMFGGNVGSLSLKVKTGNTIKSAAKLRLLGSSSASLDDWRQSSVDFTSTPDTRLVFEAISGSKHQSDIAIDKVKVCNIIVSNPLCFCQIMLSVVLDNAIQKVNF